MSRWLPYAVLAAVIFLLAQLNPTNDAAWQLWIGRQLANGATLYRDIVEVNPPLWFWLAVPVVEVSDALGISGWATLLGFFGLSAAVSIALVQRLRPGLAISLTLIFAFFLTGVSATAQREQFTLIAVTPYIFLAAARAERRAIPLWLAVACGLWAAPGLALKHYFALVPIALELWLSWTLRRWALRPELLVICAAGAAYGAIILLATHLYLSAMVPLIGEAYGAYNQPLPILLVSDVFAISVMALLGLRLVRPRSELVKALAVAGAAFLACFLLQQKGFRYQGLPAIGVFSMMAITAILQMDRSGWHGRITAILLASVPVIALATTTHQLLHPHPERDRLCQLPRGSSVLVLTPFGDFAWPAVETCGLKWSSRYMFLWMLPAIGDNPHSPLAAQVRTALYEDMLRYKPDIVIAQKGSKNGDALAFVLADPRLRAELQRYEIARSSDIAVEFRRRQKR